MRSTPYSRMCRKIFSRIFKKLNIKKDEKNHLLEMADIKMTYDEYYSMVLMNIVIAFFLSMIASLVLHSIVSSKITALLIPVIPSVTILLVATYYIYLPESRAKARARKIDVLLPYVANFIATMSSAGISPSEIFKRLSSVDLYGEIQKEARKISKEIYIMGVDTITALKHAIERSPSRKFKDFLQGIISTIRGDSQLEKLR